MVKVFRPQQCSKKKFFLFKLGKWAMQKLCDLIRKSKLNFKERIQMRIKNHFFHVGWARRPRLPAVCNHWGGCHELVHSCEPQVKVATPLLSNSNTINPVTARGWWYGRDLPTVCDHRGCLHGLVYSWVLCQVSFKSEQGKDDTTFKNMFTSQLLIYHKMYRFIPSWPTFWKQNSFRLSLYESWWT